MIRRPHLVLAVGAFLAVCLPVSAAEIPAPVLESYLKVQTALAGDSLADAQVAAKALVKQATPLGAALKTAADAAGTVAAAADIKAARAAFGTLSDSMLALAGGGTGGAGVRIAYCPMVKKSWLQAGTEIANPYYGSAMLRCGEFKK